MRKLIAEEEDGCEYEVTLAEVDGVEKELEKEAEGTALSSLCLWLSMGLSCLLSLAPCWSTELCRPLSPAKLVMEDSGKLLLLLPVLPCATELFSLLIFGILGNTDTSTHTGLGGSFFAGTCVVLRLSPRFGSGAPFVTLAGGWPLMLQVPH